MAKVIGILSLKGGVGKTSSVVSLGSALAGFGKKVLLIDANFSSPNLGLHLNVIDPEVTLHDVLGREANIGDAIIHLDNFDIIPSSLFSRIEFNPLSLRNKIKNLRRKYDVILIDSSPALNDETLACMLASDEILIVMTPDYPTISTTIKAVKLAKQRGIPISGLIMNKVYNKNFEISIKEIEAVAEIPVMAVVPHDVNISRALSEFTPSVDYKPRSEASEEYKRLAASLVGEKYKPVRLRRLFRIINPKKQDINRTIFYERIFE